MELFDKKFVYLEWDDKLEGKEVFVADCLANLRRRVDNNDHNGYSECVVDSCVEFPFRVSSGITFAMAYYDSLYEYKLAYNQGKKVEVYGFVGISRAWIEVTDDWKWEENYEYRVKPESKMWTTCINDEGVISIMLACEWNKSKGRQLIEGTREKCEIFAIENYCNKCAYHAACISQKCTMNLDMWYCQGFRELNAVKKRRMTNRELAKWLAEGNGQVRDTRTVFTFTYYNVYAVSDDDKLCPSYLMIRGWDETEWSEPIVEE